MVQKNTKKKLCSSDLCDCIHPFSLLIHSFGLVSLHTNKMLKTKKADDVTVMQAASLQQRTSEKTIFHFWNDLSVMCFVYGGCMMGCHHKDWSWGDSWNERVCSCLFSLNLHFQIFLVLLVSQLFHPHCLFSSNLCSLWLDWAPPVLDTALKYCTKGHI